MSSDDEPQLPLVMVQRSVALVPTGMPVMVVVGEPGVVMVAVPLATVHTPVPDVAALPVMANEPELQLSNLSRPASATVVGV